MEEEENLQLKVDAIKSGMKQFINNEVGCDPLFPGDPSAAE